MLTYTKYSIPTYWHVHTMKININIWTGRVWSGALCRVEKEGLQVFAEGLFLIYLLKAHSPVNPHRVTWELFLRKEFMESNSLMVSGRAFQRVGAVYLNALCLTIALGLHIINDNTSYDIDRRIYYIQICPKSIQSAVGLKALKPAANGCKILAMCAKSWPLRFIFTVQKYIIILL